MKINIKMRNFDDSEEKQNFPIWIAILITLSPNPVTVIANISSVEM